MDSILTTIKKMIGLADEYDAYNTDLLVQINSVVATLKQLGCFTSMVEVDPNTEWSELGLSTEALALVRNYIYLKCRYYFDPPQIGSLVEALKEQIAEAEWRINAAVDFGSETT